MNIASSAFPDNGNIPPKYTCDGENINPPLSISNVPQDAKSLALIVFDPDAPNGGFTHWILYNMDPHLTEIGENSVPQSAAQGKSGIEKLGYVGACPPSGTHHYFFSLYALDSMLNISNPDKDELENELQSHIIEEAELVGIYSREAQ